MSAETLHIVSKVGEWRLSRIFSHASDVAELVSREVLTVSAPPSEAPGTQFEDTAFE